MRALLFSIPVFAVALVACVIDPVELAGKQCQQDADCPEGLACVMSPQGIKTCGGYSPAPAPSPGDPTNGGQTPTAGSDAGTDAGTNTGGTGPFYCTDVKPILDTYCASCHGSPASGGAPSTFRLDVFATTGGLPGAQAKAGRIKARAADFPSMPPASSPQPSAGERSLLAAWANAGAPECADKPDSVLDGGTNGGGGGNSVGYDGGVVSFSKHVQPLLDTYCVSCHYLEDSDVGGLDLSAGRSYAMLMDRADEDSDYQRVVPSQPQASFLWIALTGSNPALIAPMPYSSPGLKITAPEDFAIIELWIQQGAPNN